MRWDQRRECCWRQSAVDAAGAGVGSASVACAVVERSSVSVLTGDCRSTAWERNAVVVVVVVADDGGDDGA